MKAIAALVSPTTSQFPMGFAMGCRMGFVMGCAMGCDMPRGPLWRKVPKRPVQKLFSGPFATPTRSPFTPPSSSFMDRSS